jgi:hypothetical protein
MAHEIYGIEHHDLKTDARTLCDHMLGEKDAMEKVYVKPWNRTAKRKKWNVHYRVVPLPFAYSIPDWFEYN